MNYISQVNKFSDMEIELLLENWMEELSDYELQELIIALKKHFRKSTFFPTIKDFVELIEGSQEDNTKIKLVDAENKFKLILKTGRSIKCDDWAIHSVIKKMGGLDEIRQGKIENEKWLIKEFLEKYQVEIQKKNVGTDIPEILYTKKDLLNIQNDMQILPEKIIGDAEQYQKWTAVLENRKKKEVTYDNNMARRD